MYGIRVDIYEETTLVLSHIFWGRTKSEAEGILRAHLKTDSFWRAAYERGEWKGIELTTERIEGHAKA